MTACEEPQALCGAETGRTGRARCRARKSAGAERAAEDRGECAPGRDRLADAYLSQIRPRLFEADSAIATCTAGFAVLTRFWKRPQHGLSGAAMVAITALLLGLLATGCVSAEAQAQRCVPRPQILSASQPSSLIPVAPRTSAAAAKWALEEMAYLLPEVAHAGLNLHMFYSEDSDDLGEDGGDGGPPQVLQSQAPSFPVFMVRGAPPAPADPTALTAKLYCERLAAWANHASRALRAEAARRASAVLVWARKVAAQLLALASRPIPDTTGAEAGVEFDAAASVFAAAQVARAAPRPTVVFVGGLTALAPPTQNFRFPTHLVALVRSTNPAQVIPAEHAWARWVTRNGGTFTAISANDSSAVIAKTLAS